MLEKNVRSVTVPSNIDEKDFLRFALFDTFRVNRRWRLPLLFACLMTAFAIVCFAAKDTHAQAVLLGSVLLGIGLLLPLVWFFLYLSSVRKEARKLGLSRDKVQYETLLDKTGVRVRRGDEVAEFPWDSIHAAWRVQGCIYLYVRPGRAFLLPDRGNADQAWEIIRLHLSEGKCRSTS